MLAGLAGSVQVALMSRLGERIGVLEALAFCVALTAVLAFVLLLVARRTLAGYGGRSISRGGCCSAASWAC